MAKRSGSVLNSDVKRASARGSSSPNAVASITKRPTGYVFAHVEGAARPIVNGKAVVGEKVPLRNGDVIELAGTQMQFIHH